MGPKRRTFASVTEAVDVINGTTSARVREGSCQEMASGVGFSVDTSAVGAEAELGRVLARDDSVEITPIPGTHVSDVFIPRVAGLRYTRCQNGSQVLLVTVLLVCALVYWRNLLPWQLPYVPVE